MIEDRSVYVRFLTGFSLATDCRKRILDIDDRVTQMTAEVRFVETDADPDEAKTSATVEMSLIHCEGMDEPSFIFDCENIEPLFHALFRLDDDRTGIASSVKRQFGLKGNNILVLSRIATENVSPLDQWLPEVLMRFRTIFEFDGAIVFEESGISSEDARNCGFAPLDPGPSGEGVWMYYILNYRPRRKKQK